MNIANAATGRSKRNNDALRQLAKDTESIGCRLRRSLDRGNAAQAEQAILDLVALRDRIGKVVG
jgi:hypothetical protein